LIIQKFRNTQTSIFSDAGTKLIWGLRTAEVPVVGKCSAPPAPLNVAGGCFTGGGRRGVAEP